MKRDANTIRHIVKLYEGGASFREIAAKLSIGKGSVSRTLDTARDHDLTSFELANLENDEIFNIFLPSVNKPRRIKELPDFTGIHNRISHTKHRSLFHEWEDYQKKNQDGYSYSRFVQLYKEWCGENHIRPVLLANEVPGMCMYVDWAGDTVTTCFNGIGPEVTISFFVTSLGASQLPYIKPFLDQKVENYVSGHNAAFRFYGGIPRFVVPDNCKTAVIYNRDYDVELNETYRAMEAYYGYCVLPARVESPTDKNDVENNVKIFEDYIIGEIELSKNEFVCFEDVEKKCSELLSEYIEKRKFKKTSKSRLEWFKEVDAPTLLPLPPEEYTFVHYEWVTVPSNYHVHIKGDAHKYSVPYEWIRKNVLLKYSYSALTVESENGEQIVKWQRVHGETLDTVHTIPEHRPKNHDIAMQLRIQDSEWFLAEAGRIGPNARAVVDKMLKSRPNPNVMFRACMGIVKMPNPKEGITADMVETICEKAVKLNRCYYAFVRDEIRALRASTEETTDKHDDAQSPKTSLPVHENIRAKNIYK